jgi:hypothetical protein
MSYLRKSVYLCRAPLCKHKNVVWQRVDAEQNVIETAVAWKHQCGRCGRGSLDLIYQEVIEPKSVLEDSPSALRDERRPRVTHPNIQENEDAQEY